MKKPKQSPDKTLRLYDNTRLSDGPRGCMRYFFFRHEMHWNPAGKAYPLVFGGAWHEAMQTVWQGFSEGWDQQKLLKEGMKTFLKDWEAAGLDPNPSQATIEEEYKQRHPGTAFEMLAGYIDRRYPWFKKEKVEILSIEKPFAVPLDPEEPDLFYIGKIDKIIRMRGRVLGIEHKTTTAYAKNGKFRAAFLESFSPNSQVDGYLFALHLMHPKKVGGVWVDAALVHKMEEGFKFIPQERQLAFLDSWLWETRTYIDTIERNREALKSCKPTDKYLAAFPKNTECCYDFQSACPYLDICRAWPNPLGKPTPPGYKVERWDPLEHLDAKQLNLPK